MGSCYFTFLDSLFCGWESSLSHKMDDLMFEVNYNEWQVWKVLTSSQNWTWTRWCHQSSSLELSSFTMSTWPAATRTWSLSKAKRMSRGWTTWECMKHGKEPTAAMEEKAFLRLIVLISSSMIILGRLEMKPKITPNYIDFNFTEWYNQIVKTGL